MILATYAALRLLQMELEARGDDRWLHPPWNRGKSRPSILDVQRLLRQHSQGIGRCLADWLDTQGNSNE